MPRGRKDQKKQALRVLVDPGFPQTVDMPGQPAGALTVLSYYGPERAYRTPVECMTVHGQAEDEAAGLALVERIRAYNPKYRNVDFALHPVGRPMILPLRAMEEGTVVRRYQRENEVLQKRWDEQVAEQRAERRGLQTRAKEAVRGRSGNLALTGADPDTGELIDEQVFGELGGDPGQAAPAPAPAPVAEVEATAAEAVEERV